MRYTLSHVTQDGHASHEPRLHARLTHHPFMCHSSRNPMAFHFMPFHACVRLLVELVSLCNHSAAPGATRSAARAARAPRPTLFTGIYSLTHPSLTIGGRGVSTQQLLIGGVASLPARGLVSGVSEYPRVL